MSTASTTPLPAIVRWIPFVRTEASLLVALFGAVFDVSMTEFTASDDDRDLAAVFLENLAIARRIFH